MIWTHHEGHQISHLVLITKINNFDVAFAHLSQNVHDTLTHDTENRSATYNNDDNDKDSAAFNGYFM